MLGPGNPDLLAIDHILVALAAVEGADARRVGSGGRLGDAERLQPQLAGGDLGEPAVLLLGAAVTQEGAHRVHLRMAGAAVSARTVGLLKYGRRCAEAEARAAERLGDEHREEALVGQGLDELRRIGPLAV